MKLKNLVNKSYYCTVGYIDSNEKLELTDAKKLLTLIRDTFSPLNIAKSAVQNIISTV